MNEYHTINLDMDREAAPNIAPVLDVIETQAPEVIQRFRALESATATSADRVAPLYASEERVREDVTTAQTKHAWSADRLRERQLRRIATPEDEKQEQADKAAHEREVARLTKLVSGNKPLRDAASANSTVLASSKRLLTVTLRRDGEVLPITMAEPVSIKRPASGGYAGLQAAQIATVGQLKEQLRTTN